MQSLYLRRGEYHYIISFSGVCGVPEGEGWPPGGWGKFKIQGCPKLIFSWTGGRGSEEPRQFERWRLAHGGICGGEGVMAGGRVPRGGETDIPALCT